MAPLAAFRAGRFGGHDLDRLRPRCTAGARLSSFLLAVRAVDLSFTEGAVRFPCNSLRIGDPVFVGARVTAFGIRLIERGDFRLRNLLTQRLQLVVAVDLKAE